MSPDVSASASLSCGLLPARRLTLSLAALSAGALLLVSTGCNRASQPVGPPSGLPTPAVAAAQPERTLVTLWDRTLRADPSHRATPSLESLSWEIVREGMDIEAPAIILTGRGGSLRLTTPATCFQESFLAMVREGGTLGYRVEGDVVSLDITGGMFYTLTRRQDVHTATGRVVGRVVQVQGLAVVSTDHDRISRDFSGAVQHSLGATAPPVAPGVKGRRGLGIAGKSVADLEATDVAVKGMKNRRGIHVDAVFPGSPAARAGIEVGDVLLVFGGRPVDNWISLRRGVAAAPAGKPVDVTVYRPRTGGEVKLKVTLGEFAMPPAPGTPGAAAPMSPPPAGPSPGGAGAPASSPSPGAGSGS